MFLFLSRRCLLLQPISTLLNLQKKIFWGCGKAPEKQFWAVSAAICHGNPPTIISGPGWASFCDGSSCAYWWMSARLGGHKGFHVKQLRCRGLRWFIPFDSVTWILFCTHEVCKSLQLLFIELASWPIQSGTVYSADIFPPVKPPTEVFNEGLSSWIDATCQLCFYGLQNASLYCWCLAAKRQFEATSLLLFYSLSC